MHAVVLVGGFGTRLRPLTNSVPKPMLPIGNVPLIARLIAGLAEGGIGDVTMALGFRPEPFMAAFPDQRCGDVRLHYAVEPEPLDTGGAIRFAADRSGVDDTFVVANGDIITDLDIGELIATHRRRGAEATLHLIGVEDPSAFGVAELAADERIVGFVEKPPPGTAPSNLVNAGTYVFEPSVLELIPSGQRVSVERDTFPRLVERGRIYGAPRDVYWLDAGRPEQYLQANLDLLDGRRAERLTEPVDPEADVAADVTLERAIVGPGAVVGAGAALRATVVMAGARIGPGAVVEESIVMGAVGDGAHLRNMVVGADGAIPAGAVVADGRVPDPDAPGGATEPAAAASPTEAAVDDRRRPILVIGGAGFIGSHLVDRLLDDGLAVDVVDDLSTGSLASLADARASIRTTTAAELHIHTLDATTPGLGELIARRRPTTIYHLALLPPHEAPAPEHGRAFASMLALMEVARRTGVDKIVVALPATALYGHPSGRELPVKERLLVARGVRGVVAKAIIDLLTSYRERWDVEFTALALTTVYGPRQRRGVVANALAAAGGGSSLTLNGDGRQTRDFLFVDDAVDALARAGERGSGLVVNIGTGVQTSLRELWSTVAPDGAGAGFGPARPDELARFAVSPVRARIHLGWAPWTALAAGLDSLRP